MRARPVTDYLSAGQDIVNLEVLDQLPTIYRAPSRQRLQACAAGHSTLQRSVLLGAERKAVRAAFRSERSDSPPAFMPRR
jgi:hypothetical protein